MLNGFIYNINVSFLIFYNKLCWCFNPNIVYYYVISITSIYLNYPIFTYFGLFFLLTTVFSLLNLFYTGLYGTFILNLISLSLL